MKEHDPALAEAHRKLRSLLTAAGFTHHPGNPGRRQIPTMGKLREWQVYAHLRPDWFHVYTFVCPLPPEPGLRSETMLWLLRKNADQSLAKYSVTKEDHVVLECELRAESVTEDTVRNVIWHVQGCADEAYLELVRIASGEARLSVLGDAFARSSSSEPGT